MTISHKRSIILHQYSASLSSNSSSVESLDFAYSSLMSSLTSLFSHNRHSHNPEQGNLLFWQLQTLFLQEVFLHLQVVKSKIFSGPDGWLFHSLSFNVVYFLPTISLRINELMVSQEGLFPFKHLIVSSFEVKSWRWRWLMWIW